MKPTFLSTRVSAALVTLHRTTTRAPILVNADKYDMASGVEKLREIMGLPNIIGTVPVSFSLVFQKLG